MKRAAIDVEAQISKDIRNKVGMSRSTSRGILAFVKANPAEHILPRKAGSGKACKVIWVKELLEIIQKEGGSTKNEPKSETQRKNIINVFLVKDVMLPFWCR
jgi:hypothetical protein